MERLRHPSALQRYVEMRVRQVLDADLRSQSAPGWLRLGTARAAAVLQAGRHKPPPAAPSAAAAAAVSSPIGPDPDISTRLPRMPPPTAKPCRPTASGSANAARLTGSEAGSRRT